MTNTYILNGSSTPTTILSSTAHGVFVTALAGGQMNPATGDFVFGVAEAYLIEHGAGDDTDPRREPDRRAIEVMSPWTRSRPTSTRGRACVARTGRPSRSGAGRRRCGSPGSRSEAPVPDLWTCARRPSRRPRATRTSRRSPRSRSTTAGSAHRGEIEGLTFAESRGVGVRCDLGRSARVRVRGRPNGRRGAGGGPAGARERGGRRARPVQRAPVEAAEPIPGLFPAAHAGMPTDRKVPIALDWNARDHDRPARGKTDAARSATRSGRAIASTEGVRVAYRADRLLGRRGLARRAGRRHADGLLVRIARNTDDLDHEGVVAEAVERAARMLGAMKPATARVPVLLDPVAASSFVGVLSGGLSAESVQKQRSLFAPLVGDSVGRRAHARRRRTVAGAAPGRRRSTRGGADPPDRALFGRGVLKGFLHNTYTAHRAAAEPFDRQRGAGLPRVARRRHHEPVRRAGRPVARAAPAEAEGGVLVQDVSGVHSGANPISGEFSVGGDGSAHLGRRAGRAGA